MEHDSDLTTEALQAALPDRPLRTYAALLSTGVAAHAWASRGAPGGAVVVAGHQLSPRGHAGRPLEHPAGEGLAFSLIMRPVLAADREGWLYTVVLTALAGVLGGDASIAWPDEVRRRGEMAAAVGISTRAAEGGQKLEWAVADVLLAHAARPRGKLLSAVLEAIEARSTADPEAVRHEYESECQTMGRRVRARMRAGTGPSVEGTAVRTLADGAIVIELGDGGQGPLRPQDARSCEVL